VWWLDGHVHSADLGKFVSNFLNVYRLRLGDMDEGCSNSEDVISDVDLVLSQDLLPEALKSKGVGRYARGSHSDADGSDDSVRATCEHAMDFVAAVWPRGASQGDCRRRAEFAAAGGMVKHALRAAAASRKRAATLAPSSNADPRPAAVATAIVSAGEVQRWYEDLRSRVNEDCRRYVNDAQCCFVGVVVSASAKFCEELSGTAGVQDNGALRLVLHGGPGAGKSYVVKSILVDELFFSVLHWTAGLDYQLVALQAVMVEMIAERPSTMPAASASKRDVTQGLVMTCLRPKKFRVAWCIGGGSS